MTSSSSNFGFTPTRYREVVLTVSKNELYFEPQNLAWTGVKGSKWSARTRAANSLQDFHQAPRHAFHLYSLQILLNNLVRSSGAV